MLRLCFLLIAIASVHADIKIDTIIEGSDGLVNLDYYLQNLSLPGGALVTQTVDRQIITAICTPGSYAPANSTVCTLCPAGTSSLGFGYWSVFNCEPCRAGYYSHAGSSVCTACPAGTFNPEISSTSVDACVACPAHTTSANGTGHFSGCHCVASYFNPDNLLPAWDHASAVQPTDWTTLPNKRQLVDIPHVTCGGGNRRLLWSDSRQLLQATTCDPGYYLDDTTCVHCIRGDYCVNNVATPCQPGYSSAAGATECTVCVGPGTNTDVALATCGIISCPAAVPIQITGTDWYGAGSIVKGKGGDKFEIPLERAVPETDWYPGQSVVGLYLNSTIDRPISYVQQTFSVVSGTTYALRFNYVCTGESCNMLFKVLWNEQTVIYSVSTVGREWVHTATSYFTADSNTGTIALHATLPQSSGYVWLSDLDLVDLSQWGYTSLSGLQLQDGISLSVPRFGSYVEGEVQIPLRVTGSDLTYDVTVLTGKQYTVGFYASGNGFVTVYYKNTADTTYTFVSEFTITGSSYQHRSVDITSFPTTTITVKIAVANTVNLGPMTLAIYEDINLAPCVFCYENNWCNGATVNQCPLNTIAPAGSDLQTDCYCQPGTYGVSTDVLGYSPCTTCPMNHYCNGGNQKEYCPPGTHSGPGVPLDGCLPCGQDLICINGTVGNCPGNSQSASHSSSIDDCICKAGYYGPPTNCQLCEPGFYCPGGPDRYACVGNATSTPGSTSAPECYCGRGYYGINNQPCNICPEGSWCWTGVLNTCPSNMWSPEYSSFQTNCTCIKGYTGEDAGPCSACEEGYYKDTLGNAQCSSCAAGKASPTMAATSESTCVPCDAGYSNPFQAQASCTPCAAGYYTSGYSSVVCDKCGGGTWSHQQADHCTNCNAGTYSTAQGAVSIATCTICSNGQYAISASTSCTDCGVCAAWTWPMATTASVGTLVHLTDININTGLLTAYYDSTHIAITQGNGIYWLNPVTGTAEHSGIYSQVSSTFSGVAIYGTSIFLVETVIYEVDISSKNVLMTYPNEGCVGVASDATTVWAGQTSTLSSYSRSTANLIATYPLPVTFTAKYGICIHPAHPGKVYVVGGWPLYFRELDNGVWSDPLASPFGLKRCTFSTDGSLIVLTGTAGAWLYSVESGTSYVIEENTFFTGGEALSQVGRWDLYMTSTDGVSKTALTVLDPSTCGPGQYNNYPGLQSAASCHVCPIGSVCSGGANMEDCLPGTYSNTTGLRVQGQCTTCKPGFYCPGGSVVTSCPLGSYSVSTGLHSSTQCPICPADSYCPNTTVSIACPDHTTSAARSQDLADCICDQGYECRLVKVVHAEITLPLTLGQFTPEMQAKYIAAVAASAGVDPSKVTIVSFQGLGGGNRRLLSLHTVEVHTNIYGVEGSPHTALRRIDHHLQNNGVPKMHIPPRITLQKEVIGAKAISH